MSGNNEVKVEVATRILLQMMLLKEILLCPETLGLWGISVPEKSMFLPGFKFLILQDLNGGKLDILGFSEC